MGVRKSTVRGEDRSTRRSSWDTRTNQRNGTCHVALGERVWGDAVAVIGTPAGQVGGGLRPDNRREDAIRHRLSAAWGDPRPPTRSAAAPRSGRSGPPRPRRGRVHARSRARGREAAGGNEPGKRCGVLARCRLGSRVPAVEDLVGVRRPVRPRRLGERRQRLVDPQVGRIRGPRAITFTAGKPRSGCRSRRAPYAPTAGP